MVVRHRLEAVDVVSVAVDKVHVEEECLGWVEEDHRRAAAEDRCNERKKT